MVAFNSRPENDDDGLVVVVVIVPRVPLGATVITPTALADCRSKGVDPCDYLARHESCDWGDLCEEDKQANDRAMCDGGRLLSAYTVDDDLKLWIITEWDRSVTTILLPEEY